MQATLTQKAVGGGGTTALVSFDEFNADDDDNGCKDDHSDSFITLSQSLSSAFGIGNEDITIGIDVVVAGKRTGVGGTSLSRSRTSSTRPELLGSTRLALRFSRQGLLVSSLSELDGSLACVLLFLSAVLRVRLAIVTKSTEGFLPVQDKQG